MFLLSAFSLSFKCGLLLPDPCPYRSCRWEFCPSDELATGTKAKLLQHFFWIILTMPQMLPISDTLTLLLIFHYLGKNGDVRTRSHGEWADKSGWNDNQTRGGRLRNTLSSNEQHLPPAHTLNQIVHFFSPSQFLSSSLRIFLISSLPASCDAPPSLLSLPVIILSPLCCFEMADFPPLEGRWDAGGVQQEQVSHYCAHSRPQGDMRALTISTVTGNGRDYHSSAFLTSVRSSQSFHSWFTRHGKFFRVDRLEQRSILRRTLTPLARIIKLSI